MHTVGKVHLPVGSVVDMFSLLDARLLWLATVASLMTKYFSSVLQAAARHNCSYLVNMQREAFLSPDVAGDKSWLQGLHCIPKKLRDLDEINKILAHRPWLITKEHIEVGTD